MMSTISSQFSLSLDDSLLFARLSGDYNPLHTDPVAARRTRFGGCVSHGVHLFLRTMDYLASQGVLDGREPASLSATFDNSVPTGTTVLLSASIDQSKVRFFAESVGHPVFSGTVELSSLLHSQPRVDDVEFAPSSPHEVDFPPQLSEGCVPIKLSSHLLSVLFPSLANKPSLCWLADLIATTQIVGMRCPGMHSVYSGFRLRREVQHEGSPAIMHYRVSGMEKRLHLLRVQVNGMCLTGALDTFFRPRPVLQRSMVGVAATVPSAAFAGHRVLVVGGSRGLGELTAKITAAGGANVTITYASGRDDAERICAEVRAFGANCSAHQMNVMEAAAQAGPQWLTSSHFSHIYYYASPLISKNPGRWNELLFHQFTHTYVTAFSSLVEQVLTGRRNQNGVVCFFYPSSIFVTQPTTGFAEYAVAKAAGEAFCDQLHGKRGALFEKPRLPRMRTDQTSSLPGVGAEDPFRVMLDAVLTFHRARA